MYMSTINNIVTVKCSFAPVEVLWHDLRALPPVELCLHRPLAGLDGTPVPGRVRCEQEGGQQHPRCQDQQAAEDQTVNLGQRELKSDPGKYLDGGQGAKIQLKKFKINPDAAYKISH